MNASEPTKPSPLIPLGTNWPFPVVNGKYRSN